MSRTGSAIFGSGLPPSAHLHRYLRTCRRLFARLHDFKVKWNADDVSTDLVTFLLLVVVQVVIRNRHQLRVFRLVLRAAVVG